MIKLFKPITNIVSNIRSFYYLSSRKWTKFIVKYNKYNSIKIPTLDGYYTDKSEILLHSMFALLTSFVEEEVAPIHYWGYVYKNKDKNKFLYYLDKFFWTRLSKLEKKVYGVDALLERAENDSKVSLIENSYKEEINFYKEVYDLYKWWTFDRSKRLDPNDISGLSDFWEKHPKPFKFVPIENSELLRMETNLSELEDQEFSKLCELSHKIEEEQEEEDNKMLHRLINIRRGLWT